jgi:predicted transcriptional regulator
MTGEKELTIELPVDIEKQVIEIAMRTGRSEPDVVLDALQHYCYIEAAHARRCNIHVEDAYRED